MRLLDLELRSWDGERPVLLQALAHAVLFYLTIGATCSLILLFALINRRSRTLHDVLSGMLMVRSSGLVWTDRAASRRAAAHCGCSPRTAQSATLTGSSTCQEGVERA